MVEILVSRDPGGKISPNDIVDPLITSIPVALARGATEINKSCSNRKQVGISTTLLPWTMPGGLVAVTTSKGKRTGKLRSFEKVYTVSKTEFLAECNIGVEFVDE